VRGGEAVAVRKVDRWARQGATEAWVVTPLVMDVLREGREEERRDEYAFAALTRVLWSMRDRDRYSMQMCVGFRLRMVDSRELGGFAIVLE